VNVSAAFTGMRNGVSNLKVPAQTWRHLRGLPHCPLRVCIPHIGREESFEAPGWMRRGAKRARPRISDSRDPIPYALETDWPLEAAGFETLHLESELAKTLSLGREDSNLCISESEFAKTLSPGRQDSSISIEVCRAAPHSRRKSQAMIDSSGSDSEMQRFESSRRFRHPARRIQLRTKANADLPDLDHPELYWRVARLGVATLPQGRPLRPVRDARERLRQ
jgi:hypothetical protein